MQNNIIEARQAGRVQFPIYSNIEICDRPTIWYKKAPDPYLYFYDGEMSRNVAKRFADDNPNPL